MTSVTFKSNSSKVFKIPVTLYNIKTNKPVTISMILDTAAENVWLGGMDATLVGIPNARQNAIESRNDGYYYLHRMYASIGSLNKGVVSAWVCNPCASHGAVSGQFGFGGTGIANWTMDIDRGGNTVTFRDAGDSIPGPKGSAVTFRNPRNSEGLFHVPVTIINPDAKKEVSLDLELDTGSLTTTLNAKYARMLGINNWKKGGTTKNISWWSSSEPMTLRRYPLALHVGSLGSVPINVDFTDEPGFPNLLGAHAIYQFRTIWRMNSITFEQPPKPVLGGLSIASRSNFTANWRNRT